ncbi:MAG: flagellar M-ring protein FliF [Nitrospirae bacterium]|nr:flagellar M-ring protein FliF [Nitrospirota bacterium]MBF0534922.1 flagellar M-ring protein FliF [Nitrospirota bacterium]MBF0617227.1 flagellar M-ring protein FliF [Nitrospirota bacterium]
MADIKLLIEKVKNWPDKKKAVMAGFVVLGLAAIIVIFAWSQKVPYQVLFSNLADEDAGKIVAKLKDLKVPYKVTQNSIMVPQEKVHELRIQLATAGLPQGTGVGFEIFDKPDFQATDFVQKLNYRRALEGELARTIASLEEIDKAKVHLAIPEKSLFVKDKELPTASIVVNLKQKKALTQEQIQGIVHLVSSSVEGLIPNNITVLNSQGELLTRPTDELIGLTATQLEYQRKIEKELQQRIGEILGPVVGREKVKARVSLELDFAKTEKTEEKFDPEGSVVRSEQSMKEKSVTTGPGGIPGVQSNLPGKTPLQGAGMQTSTQKQSETTNYEISKVVSHVTGPYGSVKRISAAVLVDGIYKEKTAPKDAKKKDTTAPEQVYVPRTDVELKQYGDLVKKAIGYTEKRGDEVTVINMPFGGIPKEEPEKRDYVKDSVMLAKYLAPVLLALLFIIFVVRPIMKSLTEPPQAPDLPKLKPMPELIEKQAKQSQKQLEPERERDVSMPPEEEPGILQDLNDWAKWVQDNPNQASQIVREWMEHEEA